MKIAFVGGTAGLGYGLALRAASGGAQVSIGSRDSERGLATGRKIQEATGTAAGGGSNDSVLSGADLVVVTVPYPGLIATYKMIKEHAASGTPVLDCNVPLQSEIGGRVTRLIGAWEGSAAEQARAILGAGSHVAAGFHTVSAGLLAETTLPLDSDILICGDREAKVPAKDLVGMVMGARYVDCGPLDRARLLESLAALVIAINIDHKLESGAGVRITGLKG